MPPPTTSTWPLKTDWVLNCRTPSPVLLIPPAVPTTAWRMSEACNGDTSVEPLISIVPTLTVFIVEPKSTRPSIRAVVPTLAEVTTMPDEPIVNLPAIPAVLVVLKVRTVGVAVPPRLLKTKPVWMLSP